MGDVAYIALGSNIGDREAHLQYAREEIGRMTGTRLLAASDVEETAPVGPVLQGAFLNQMIAIETTLEPRDLLAKLQRIEAARGRVRAERWGPRTLDIDIVLMDGHSANTPDLVLPHPELPHRDFWQRELAQIRPTS